MKTLSIRVEDDFFRQVEEIAEKGYSGNKSDLTRAALDALVNEFRKQYDNIPSEIKTRIAFIMQLTLTGHPDKDWEIVQSEVMELWKNVQS